MDYQFTHTMHGVMAKCSMDHEAFAHWLNTEIVQNFIELQDILTEITKCKLAPNYETIFEGREYTLYLNAEEVMVKANNLAMDIEDFEQMEEGFNFYNEESIAFCGLEDFEVFLQAYDRFTKTFH
ncbi:hypothetical protein A6B43_07390 [Vespertiliibacter pulmonis]|uniref:UPF0231 protein EDC46_0146 n=1 Tax=Vespertiliibacter pulmonis TaxID=1443036 RepID=A0A3N4VRP6_9PAST|nr:YacL family protein [Vespertiliibacter pulmonis]QLB21355.1 hypothetical protein A6B43_07390 [Vespertiliibacter pulmonis]RPE85766.1 hypothetical protein EDC46_0146 [Vespertiliibacter pulmonis]